MNIAYLILAHGQPTMFRRLVKALETPYTHFFVHIDMKANQVDFETECKQGRIDFVSERTNVNHSGFSQTEAMLKLLRVATSYDDFDYFIFLSGQDYPVKSNEYIKSFLKKHSGLNFINFYPLEGDAAFSKNIRKYHFVDELRRYPSVVRKPLKAFIWVFNKILPDRPFIEGMTPYRGSTSWCLTESTAKYIVEFAMDKNNDSFLRYFKCVHGSDEIFFQTIVLNSSLAIKCRYYERDIIKATNYLKNENKAYLHYIDWNIGRENPAILDMQDAQRLKGCEALFARKFSTSKSEKLLDYIDEYLR